MRHAYLYILVVLGNGLTISAAHSDPLGTAAMPRKSASSQHGVAAEPCAAQSPDHPLDLPEVVDFALCNNPQTHEVWANTRAQEAQVGVNQAGYYPDISLNAVGIRTKTDTSSSVDRRSVAATLSYLLYDFGARAANLESARQLLAAASATQDSKVQSVFLAAVQAYYQTQAGLAALDAAIESERAAKQSFAAAQARYVAGSATPADKLQAQTAYSQATLNRISADGNLKNAQGTLANMLGLDANRNINLVAANTTAMPDNFEGDVNTLIEQARQRRPDLQAATAQVQAAQASADAARAAGRPTVSLTASTDQNNVAGINSRSSTLGINLSVPIFTGYATTYRVRAAEAQTDAMNARLEQLRLQVSLDVWTAYQHLITATQLLRTTVDLLSSAEQSERVALGRYRAGVGSILDVLNAQSALASARQQRIQSTFDWNINRAALAQAMGSLDASLLQTLPDTSQTGSGNPQSDVNSIQN